MTAGTDRPLNARPRGWRRPLRTAGGTCALLFACVGSLAAQDGDPRPAGRLRLGGLTLTPKVTLQDMGVDSNVFNTITAPVSDFTFTLTPRLDMAAGARRASMTAYAESDLVYFAHYRSERSANRTFGVAGRVALHRLTLLADGGYNNTRRRVNDEIDARSRRIDHQASAGVRLTVTPKIAIDATGRYTRTVFDPGAVFDHARLSELLNREARTAIGSVRYAVTPLTAITVAADVERARFQFSPIRDSETRGLRLGVELHPRALVSGSATVGVERLRPGHPSLPAFSGTVGSVNLSYSLLRTLLSVSADRNLVYSYAEREPYYVAEGYGIALQRQLSDRWNADLRLRRTWHHYRALLGDPGMSEGRAETLLNAGAAIGYLIRRGTRATFSVSHWKRRSPQRDYRNFDGLRAGTTLTIGF